MPRREWKAAVQKCHEDEAWCRVCGGTYQVEAAHILGRKFDQPKTPRSKTLYVDPDSVVPLCRKHHEAYDAHEIGILNILTEAEQVKAVSDAGSIETALRRIDAPRFKEQDELLARVLELESTAAKNGEAA